MSNKYLEKIAKVQKFDATKEDIDDTIKALRKLHGQRAKSPKYVATGAGIGGVIGGVGYKSKMGALVGAAVGGAIGARKNLRARKKVKELDKYIDKVAAFDTSREATGNPYLDKIAGMKSSGSTTSSTGKPSPTKMSTKAPVDFKRGGRTLRMGPNTTPDDLLPNPGKMDVRIT